MNIKSTGHHLRVFLIFPIVILIVLSFRVSLARSDNRTVTVGVYENAPKVFISESGKPAGIFVDIIEHIAEKEGWSLRYVPGTWTEGLDRLRNGDIDLMPDVAYTSDRAEIYAFHNEPVLSSWFQVYARKGSGIRSILDLGGKRIAVLNQSVQQAAFIRLTAGFGIDATIISVPDYRTIFEIVAMNGADAAITNRFYGVMHAKQYGLEDTTVVFNPSTLFFAASKNSPIEMLDAIDKHILNIKSDPGSIYYGSLKRWISEEVRFKLPVWVGTLGWVAGVILIMSVAGSIFLKYQVNERTRQLRKVNQDMEQRIARRTAELAAAVEKAREADRIKSSFLATMSHELRTPLNSIIGFTGIMLQGLAGPLNPEQHKQMSMVQGSARHLLALINDVLDISKIEAGQLTISATSFYLTASIEKMVKLVSPLAEKKGLDLKMDVARDIGTVTTDQRRLEQIILNLLNNAVKFTEKGHVTVLCHAENGRYCLSVSDSGIGIQAEQLKNIFQPFHQIDTGLARKYEGTGLGLSICKKLVEMMGGDIAVESRWGQGSTFTIRFPIHSGASS
ncbi:MAG TPA: transporter substrate-binding domain-containing protein [Deltaproteobacteria bacterium]|nr:transporter substrate-binding domain-containing protein [Deltaproteobacteria bacterium]